MFSIINRILFFALIIFIISCGSSNYYYPKPKANNQYTSTSEEFKGQYASFLSEGETEVNSWYHYMTSNTENGDYIVRTFFPEKNQITSLVTYNSKDSMIKNGDFKEWYDNGSKLDEGQYLNGKKTGTWKYFHYDTNILRDSGEYVHDEKEGIWFEFNSEGLKNATYTYVDGSREGQFQMFDSLGNISNEGVYKADTIFSQNNPDPKPVIENVEPKFSACKNTDTINGYIVDCDGRELANFISQHFLYPEKARELNVQGTAYIQFVVDSTGQVQDIEVMRGICEPVAEECLRLINKMPDWHQPGIQAGKAVRVRYTIPIRLRLG